MDKPTARVLSLPTAADVREEAERMGIPYESLEGFLGPLGSTAVKLRHVPPQVAATLQQTVPPDQVMIALSAPGAGHSLLEADQLQLILAGPKPMLLQTASRLESSASTPEKEVAAALQSALRGYEGLEGMTTRCGKLNLEWGKRTYVMGILNVSPDSFSGDGIAGNVEAAVEQGRRFVEDGADILDVGGESTRPGSEPVPVVVEMERVIPVVRRLVQELEVPISVDSYKVEVAQAALEAGASMINDVWGLRRAEGLADLAATYNVPIVLMHNRRAQATKSQLGGHFQQVQYLDLMGEIVDELRESVELALSHGVKRENIIVDPGIGFGKTPQQNLVVMRRLREVRSLGHPILMGTSRKSVIGLTLGLPMDERVEGTAATVAVSICNGADMVRVHDVKQMVRVARMTDAIVRKPQ